MEQRGERSVKQCRHLMMAAKEGDLEAVHWLLDHGADLSARDSKGRTALFLSVAKGKTEVARHLMTLSDCLETDVNGWGLLHAAVLSGKPDLVTSLAGRLGPDPPSRSGATPLFLAANLGRADLVDALLGAGADPGAADTEGWTPLHVAAWSAALDATERCARRQVDAKSRDGRTALSLAVERGHSAVVRLLLEMGANPNIADNQGVTPALKARLGHHTEVLQLLKAYGAQGLI